MSRITFGLLLCAACCGAVRSAQAESLEEKLGTATDYVPQAIAPLDQLVEVAQRFKIPMAIEWVERPGTTTPDKTPPARKRSVRELIEEIARVSPEHRVEVEGGLVCVYSPIAAVHPFNFLNIRLESYELKDGDLFAADAHCRLDLSGNGVGSDPLQLGVGVGLAEITAVEVDAEPRAIDVAHEF